MSLSLLVELIVHILITPMLISSHTHSKDLAVHQIGTTDDVHLLGKGNLLGILRLFRSMMIGGAPFYKCVEAKNAELTMKVLF